MIVITEFGKALRKLRIDRGDILKTMADKLNMTASYLSAIECGKRNIPSDLISKLTLVYDLTAAEQEILSEAHDRSLNSIEIELSTNSTNKRDLALQFARKFDDIDDDIAIQMLKFLNNKKGEQIISKICVEAKSRTELRLLAKKIRETLDLSNELYFPITEVLELLHKFDEDAHFEVVEAYELEENEHAVTDITTKAIKIRTDVYNGACDGVGRDRMTIAHEFAHFITLCVLGFKLARSFDKADIPPYRDPEWQAKCLAGELLIDSDLVEGMSATEISEKCGVSYDAAKFQLSKL